MSDEKTVEVVPVDASVEPVPEPTPVEPVPEPAPQTAVVKVQAELDGIIAGIKNILAGKNLDSSNILQITVQTMSTTAKLRQFNGQQKKSVLLDALRTIIEAQDMPPDTKNIIEFLLNNLVATAIDLFYDVRRGTIKFPVPGKGCC